MLADAAASGGISLLKSVSERAKTAGAVRDTRRLFPKNPVSLAAELSQASQLIGGGGFLVVKEGESADVDTLPRAAILPDGSDQTRNGRRRLPGDQSKKAKARASTLTRGGASAGALGSVNAVCGTRTGRVGSES